MRSHVTPPHLTSPHLTSPSHLTSRTVRCASSPWWFSPPSNGTCLIPRLAVGLALCSVERSSHCTPARSAVQCGAKYSHGTRRVSTRKGSHQLPMGCASSPRPAVGLALCSVERASHCTCGAVPNIRTAAAMSACAPGKQSAERGHKACTPARAQPALGGPRSSQPAGLAPPPLIFTPLYRALAAGSLENGTA